MIHLVQGLVSSLGPSSYSANIDTFVYVKKVIVLYYISC